MIEKLLLPVSVLYTLILIVATLMNPSDIPDLGITMQDKLFHVLAYLVLAVIWILYFQTQKNKPKLIYVILGLLLVGIVLEMIQHKINPKRSFDLYDMLTNGIGVIVGTIIVLKIKLINWI